jgi:hypothetical protein
MRMRRNVQVKQLHLTAAGTVQLIHSEDNMLDALGYSLQPSRFPNSISTAISASRAACTTLSALFPVRASACHTLICIACQRRRGGNALSPGRIGRLDLIRSIRQLDLTFADRLLRLAGQ